MQDTLIIIDGSSFVFRAFHAMPPLTSPNGKPTGATRGVINMLKLMQKKYTTRHYACVFDAPGKNFRDEIHPEYKATRRETPTDLITQLEDIYAITKALGIPVIIESGIEADDIIGKLAILGKNSGMKVLIATGDKDFAQLVDNDITLINTMTNETLDIDGVINKFGVKPEQIIDYLSLVGDKVDNIPGVDKCGPKTAVKWLTEYQTLDNIINNANSIPGVVGENLRKAIPWLATAKKLVTIDTKIELKQDITNIHELICKAPDIDTLCKYYTELGFKTWLEQDCHVTHATPNDIGITLGIAKDNDRSQIANNLNTQDNTTITHPTIQRAITQINSTSELKILIDKLIQDSSPIALLIVGDSYPEPKQLKTLAIANTNNSYLIKIDSNAIDLFDTANTDNDYLPLIGQLLVSAVPKVLPNAKETLQLLAKCGLRLNKLEGDLTLAHYIKNSKQKHSISSIYQEYLDLDVADLPVINTKPSKDSVWLNDSLTIQNCEAIINHIISLEAKLREEMSTDELNLYQNVELPLAQILVNIETNGIMLDIAKFKLLEQELSSGIKLLEDKIYAEAHCVFNINSTKQLQDVLFNQLKLPIAGIKKNTNGYSTDEDTLTILAEQNIPIANYMLEYRTLTKLLNTYVAKLPLLTDINHRVHTTFDQAFVASGRLSSRDPNLQNIPVKNDWGRRIRQCFIASMGNKLICADYSQIELRILAHLSMDNNLISAFNNNQDIHSSTASEIFQKPINEVSKDERRYAKIINFSLLYGKTVFGLAEELRIDRATAKLYIDTYFAKYPKIKACMDGIKNFAHEHGYVQTVFGRRIYLPNISSNNRIIREAEERLALNAPMQGTSADIIKFAMVAIDKWIQNNNLQTKMVLQVHDELIFDVPLNEVKLIQNNIPRLMTDTVTLLVKMAVDVKVADNWDEAH
jgi:DNA polymerase-1